MSMEEIKIKVPKGKKAEWVNGVLTLIDEPIDIKERVKTYEDACEVLGISPVLNCPNLCICEKHEETGEMHEHFSFRQNVDRHTLAYLKLGVIVAALNEGWNPLFCVDRYRYYPWFYIYNKKKYEEFSDKEKEKCRVVYRGWYYYAIAYGDVSYASAIDDGSSSFLSVGSRLALKTRELAEYCGEQFIDIWKDFYRV